MQLMRLEHFVKMTANDKSTDFRSASTNFIKFGIAKIATSWIVVDITIT